MTKKILLLSFEMPPYLVGGIGTVAYELIKGFKKLKYEVIVIAPKDDREFKITGIQYERISIKGNQTKTFQMFRRALKICVKEKVDFIYALSGTYPGIIAFIIKKFMKIPYFTMAYGNEFIRFHNNIIMRKLINFIYHSSNKVFSISTFTKNLLISFGVNQKNIYVCFCGVDLERFYPIDGFLKKNYLKKFGVSEEKFVLLTISRIDRRKNHIGVIKALEKIDEENPFLFNKLVYLIGGRGKEYQNIKNYIDKKNFKNKVKLLGYIEDDDVNKLYNASDLFIMPNLYIKEDGNVEGFGLVFLEAGATKLASIGGNLGGSAEAIDHNKNGYLVDGNDYVDLKNKIIYLMENKPILENFSKEALKKALEYSWENIIGNINKEIENILGERNERG